MSLDLVSALKRICELEAENKRLMKCLIAANKLVNVMPTECSVWCGSCGKKLRPVTDPKLLEWREKLHTALVGVAH